MWKQKKLLMVAASKNQHLLVLQVLNPADGIILKVVVHMWTLADCGILSRHFLFLKRNNQYHCQINWKKSLVTALKFTAPQ